MGIESERVSKEDVFKSIVSSAVEFYKLIITVASAFLGGSLIFIEKLAPSQMLTKGSVRILGSGWLFLILAIIAVGVVQRYNLRSGQLVMDGQVEKSRKIDSWTSRGTTLAIFSLALGIFFI